MTPRTIVHGILQSRILEGVAFPFLRGSSQPRDKIQVSCIASRLFTITATRVAQVTWSCLTIYNPMLNTVELRGMWGNQWKITVHQHFSLLQVTLFSRSVVSDSEIPWTAAHQASLSFTISWSLLKLTFIESVIPSNHLILCHPLFLPSVFPRIRVFSNESALCIRWPKYWRRDMEFGTLFWIFMTDFL